MPTTKREQRFAEVNQTLSEFGASTNRRLADALGIKRPLLRSWMKRNACHESAQWSEVFVMYHNAEQNCVFIERFYLHHRLLDRWPSLLDHEAYKFEGIGPIQEHAIGWDGPVPTKMVYDTRTYSEVIRDRPAPKTMFREAIDGLYSHPRVHTVTGRLATWIDVVRVAFWMLEITITLKLYPSMRDTEQVWEMTLLPSLAGGGTIQLRQPATNSAY